MNFRLYILAVTLLLLVTRPAAAESDLAFAWDLSVAPTSAQPTVGDDACQSNPYALYRRGCPDELNIGLERSNERHSTLDQLLVLADRYKSLNLDTDIRPNAQLKFTLGLVNLYDQDAQARLTFKLRF